MRTAHIICLIFAILFTAAAIISCSLALSVCLTPPEQSGSETGDPMTDAVGNAVGAVAAGCARGLVTGLFGVLGAILAAIGLIFSAVGWNARPRGARIAFRVLLVLNLLCIAAGLLAPALLTVGT